MQFEVTVTIAVTADSVLAAVTRVDRAITNAKGTSGAFDRFEVTAVEGTKIVSKR